MRNCRFIKLPNSVTTTPSGAVPRGYAVWNSTPGRMNQFRAQRQFDAIMMTLSDDIIRHYQISSAENKKHKYLIHNIRLYLWQTNDKIPD